MEINIRQALQSDLKEITAIYNHAVAGKISTAETVPVSAEEKQQWFDEHSETKFPLSVAAYQNEITGWICLSAYRKGRQALEQTVEISYYVHPHYHQKGIGSLMMEAMIEKARQLGYKNLVAILIDANTASISLLKKFGFTQWGLMPGIVDMGDKKYGHAYYGRSI